VGEGLRARVEPEWLGVEVLRRNRCFGDTLPCSARAHCIEEVNEARCAQDERIKCSVGMKARFARTSASCALDLATVCRYLSAST
jgi:hypothetical protein